MEIMSFVIASTKKCSCSSFFRCLNASTTFYYDFLYRRAWGCFLVDQNGFDQFNNSSKLDMKYSVDKWGGGGLLKCLFYLIRAIKSKCVRSEEGIKNAPNYVDVVCTKPLTHKNWKENRYILLVIFPRSTIHFQLLIMIK